MSENDAIETELRRALRRSTGDASSANCPPAASWIALLAQEVAQVEAERLRHHLVECAACARTAADARRFLVAMDAAKPAAQAARSRRRAIAAVGGVAGVAGIAAAALIAAVSVLLRDSTPRGTPDATAELVAALEPPPAPAPESAMTGQSTSSELVYRGVGSLESDRSFAAALTPYRNRQFAAACRALAEHGRSFPADREARFFAAVSCLKARELDQAEALLASLAAVAGDRREDARALLERLRRARRSVPR